MKSSKGNKKSPRKPKNEKEASPKKSGSLIDRKVHSIDLGKFTRFELNPLRKKLMQNQELVGKNNSAIAARRRQAPNEFDPGLNQKRIVATASNFSYGPSEGRSVQTVSEQNAANNIQLKINFSEKQFESIGRINSL